MKRRTSLVFMSCLSFAGFAVSAGCTGASAPEEGSEEAMIAAAKQADKTTLAPPGDPRSDPQCQNSGNYTLHNAGWPYRAPGACPAFDPHTFDDAATSCQGNVKYYGYVCTDFPATGNHSWTVYYGCCPAAPSCPPGFTGPGCATNIDECASSPCLHGACIDQVNAYLCDCQPGFTGSNCEVDIDECESSPCVHGACVDQVNAYLCDCAPGFTGANCDVDIDECESSPCVHGACVDEVDAYSCDCEPGFTGPLCDDLADP